MIIIRIGGGLGNQMFQYAFARSISLRNNISFKLDLSWFDILPCPREYGLNYFNITENIATAKDVAMVLNKDSNKYLRFVRKVKNRLTPYYGRYFIREKNFPFDENLLKIKQDTYVKGHFVSYIYLKGFEDILKRDFELKNPPDEINNQVINDIRKKNSICLHFRRGDFVKKSYHDVCNMDYFDDAIKYLVKRVKNPFFFIFSDGSDWVRSNLKIKHPHMFITHNLHKPHEDLRLMTYCKHYIIPNSTFSWWGAWLSQNPEKLVICPLYWFSDRTIDYSKMIPSDWVQIHNKFA